MAVGIGSFIARIRSSRGIGSRRSFTTIISSGDKSSKSFACFSFLSGLSKPSASSASSAFVTGVAPCLMSLFVPFELEEKNVVSLLREPMPRDDLIRAMKLPIPTANAVLSVMEIKELIKEEMGEIRLM